LGKGTHGGKGKKHLHLGARIFKPEKARGGNERRVRPSPEGKRRKGGGQKKTRCPRPAPSSFAQGGKRVNEQKGYPRRGVKKKKALPRGVPPERGAHYCQLFPLFHRKGGKKTWPAEPPGKKENGEPTGKGDIKETGKTEGEKKVTALPPGKRNLFCRPGSLGLHRRSTPRHKGNWKGARLAIKKKYDRPCEKKKIPSKTRGRGIGKKKKV